MIGNCAFTVAKNWFSAAYKYTCGGEPTTDNVKAYKSSTVKPNILFLNIMVSLMYVCNGHSKWERMNGQINVQNDSISQNFRKKWIHGPYPEY